MGRAGLLIATLFCATATQAGDLLEDMHFYVVGSIPADLRVKEMTDVAGPAFRERVFELQAEWSEECGVPVSVWHSNLMFNENTPWTSDYWFAYISSAETEAQVRVLAPATPCAADGFIKLGDITFPTVWMICADPENYPDLYQDTCF